MKEAENELYKIPIMLVIWRNKDRISKLFSYLPKVRPAKLYIFQDGSKDEENAKQLDEALDFAKSLVDWPCEVSTYRLDKNLGPSAAEMYAFDWFFSKEEMGIITEDDVIPDLSFFPLAEYLLNKYKDNPKIGYITSVNPYEVFKKADTDIIYTTRGAQYCWATWKRFINLLDDDYKWADDPNAPKIWAERSLYKKDVPSIMKKGAELKAKSDRDFELQVCAAITFNDMFSIVPRKNMSTNIGLDGIHNNSSLKRMPKSVQKQFYMKTYPCQIPPTEPEKIEEQPGFRKFYNRNFFRKFVTRIDGAIRKMIYRKN